MHKKYRVTLCPEPSVPFSTDSRYGNSGTGGRCLGKSSQHEAGNRELAVYHCRCPD